ncbi:hypothetical protein [Flagellimonas pacifica]|uniref:Uncharacterized protein n=1 Tax=Flagellimonas pacifica TaxID=1247520 RepID=A0A285MSR6_9FLAO|nr:hypothetical protein [Allomuricauda parva]SNZ00225.1 hypothetical protein SAMN06265377_2045 [Allomuricauda parva]
MELTDKIWQELEGGYKTLYDASVPLSQLENTDDPEDIKKVWEELWNELHHQGDVGTASYLAIPQLVRIGIKKDLFDWNLLGLCAVIEQQRHLGSNPSLLPEYQDNYKKGLLDLKEFVIKNLNNDLDKTTSIMALSTIATCDGRIKMGKAIMEMEDEDLLNEFLEQF